MDNGIHIVLGDHRNPKSNCSVDKIICELEVELKRLCPTGAKLDAGTLSRAVMILTGKVRGQGLSASQVLFSRDANTGANLSLNDRKIGDTKEASKIKKGRAAGSSKARGAPEHTKAHTKPGDVVYLKSDGGKHLARDRSSATGDTQTTVQKMLHMSDRHQAAPKLISQKLRIEEKFLFVAHKSTRPVTAGPDHLSGVGDTSSGAKYGAKPVERARRNAQTGAQADGGPGNKHQ